MDNALTNLKPPITELETSSPSPIVINWLELKKVKLKVLQQIYKVALTQKSHPIRALQLLRIIKKKYKKTFGEKFLSKVARIDGRYFWRLGAPGFPSAASYKMHENEISRFTPSTSRHGLRSLLFAITKKCPLNCEHCFEWNNLSNSDTLTTNDIIQIVHKYQEYGTTQVMFSGGEPMLRFNDIISVLDVAFKGTDFWVITSGLGLTLDRAIQLKAAGLTGVMVSLDHFLPEKHNQFRGFPNSFEWAINAIKSANKANLVTTMALCATKEFTNRDNLERYMDLAKSLGVSFVQIIEPRATGRYAGKNIDLTSDQISLLDEVYHTYNSENRYASYPIINYLGYHQRKVGCFGAGNRFFYVDTDGDAHICPYCSNKVGSVITSSPEVTIDRLATHTCHTYENNVVI